MHPFNSPFVIYTLVPNQMQFESFAMFVSNFPTYQTLMTCDDWNQLRTTNPKKNVDIHIQQETHYGYIC
jgi:hypothetical protein